MSIRKVNQQARLGNDLEALRSRGQKAINDLQAVRSQFGQVRNAAANADHLTPAERNDATAEVDGVADDLIAQIKAFAAELPDPSA